MINFTTGQLQKRVLLTFFSMPSPLVCGSWATTSTQVTTRAAVGLTSSSSGKALLMCSAARRKTSGLESWRKKTLPTPSLVSRSPCRAAIMPNLGGILPRYVDSLSGCAVATKPLVLIWNWKNKFVTWRWRKTRGYSFLLTQQKKTYFIQTSFVLFSKLIILMIQKRCYVPPWSFWTNRLSFNRVFTHLLVY